MNPAAIIARLERFPRTLAAACDGLSRDDALYRADGRSWSILEIVCHLADEEHLDFPRRLESTLTDPTKPWDPIDPEGWASQHIYREQDLGEQIQLFTTRRAERVAWARGLTGPAWDNAYQHPQIGPIRAGDLLAAWGVHDALHLRQISKRFYELGVRDGGGYSTAYAGEWT